MKRKKKTKSYMTLAREKNRNGCNIPTRNLDSKH